MPIERCITLYKLDELEPAARKRAIETFRKAVPEEFDDEYIIDDFVEVCRLLGLEIETVPVKLMGGGTKQKPCVWYSVGGCQSDGASFEGRYRSVADPVASIKQHAPQDTELVEIAADLNAISEGHASVSANVRQTGRYNNLSIDWTEVEDSEGETSELSSHQEEQLLTAFKGLAGWLYDRLDSEYEYQSSEEFAIEEINAADRLFEADGSFYE